MNIQWMFKMKFIKVKDISINLTQNTAFGNTLFPSLLPLCEAILGGLVHEYR